MIHARMAFLLHDFRWRLYVWGNAADGKTWSTMLRAEEAEHFLDDTVTEEVLRQWNECLPEVARETVSTAISMAYATRTPKR